MSQSKRDFLATLSSPIILVCLFQIIRGHIQMYEQFFPELSRYRERFRGNSHPPLEKNHTQHSQQRGGGTFQHCEDRGNCCYGADMSNATSPLPLPPPPPKKT